MSSHSLQVSWPAYAIPAYYRHQSLHFCGRVREGRHAHETLMIYGSRSPLYHISTLQIFPVTILLAGSLTAVQLQTFYCDTNHVQEDVTTATRPSLGRSKKTMQAVLLRLAAIIDSQRSPRMLQATKKNREPLDPPWN
jgi:hypothetical protein